MRRRQASWCGVAATAAAWFSLACTPTFDRAEDTPKVLVVHRGSLEEHLVLTGVVETSKATEFSPPRTDQWNLSIQWLAEDGATVKAGEPLISFDNTAVVDKLNELELAAIEAGVDLTSQQATAAVEASDKRFAVVENETAVAKAKLDAQIPAEILSRKEVRDFAIAYSRATSELGKARGELAKTEKGGKLESSVKQIAFDKAKRAYNRAGEQLDGLDINAPRDGIFVVKKHPREDRKLQVGDNVWPGTAVGGLPDLSKLVIEAELSDVDEGRIQSGMAASCTVDAFADAPLNGAVTAVSPVAQETETRTRRRFFTVRVGLETVEEQNLRPGLSAAVDVVTRRVEDALLAPREALLFDEEQIQALLADGTHVPVEITFCTALLCVIESGLTEGQELQHRGGLR